MADNLSWLAEARKEYKNLDGSQRIQVNKGLEKIRQDSFNAGKPLVGNLIGLREIKMKRLGLRIIFQPTEDGPLVAEIVVVGKRSDDVAFIDAIKRLGRN
jgi:mRNA interferase RelE/StbE